MITDRHCSVIRSHHLLPLQHNLPLPSLFLLLAFFSMTGSLKCIWCVIGVPLTAYLLVVTILGDAQPVFETLPFVFLDAKAVSLLLRGSFTSTLVSWPVETITASRYNLLCVFCVRNSVDLHRLLSLTYQSVECLFICRSVSLWFAFPGFFSAVSDEASGLWLTEDRDVGGLD